MSQDHAYMQRHIAPLIGGTIVQLVASDGESHEQDVFGIEVRKPDGKTVVAWILCDPEGNGPGHLDIQEG